MHALPFKADCIDCASGGAVMEHVADPPWATRELYRVVRPGGYVYADWACVFAYHGYPHHYFNATVSGIRNAFDQFRVLETGVAPFQQAAFTLRSVIQTYLECFQPRTLREHWFAADLERVLWASLDEYDRRIDPAERFRVAAAVYAFAVKQPAGDERLLPDALMEIYARSAELQARYPDPLNISIPRQSVAVGKDGRRRARASAARLAGCRAVLLQWFEPGRPYDRGTIQTWTPELVSEVNPQPPREKDLGQWPRRRRSVRIPFGWSRTGPIGMLRRRTEALLRWSGLLPTRRHIIGS